MTGESSWLTTVQPVRPVFVRLHAPRSGLYSEVIIEAGFDESP